MKKPGGDWIHKFVFSLEPCQLVDYQARCNFHQHDPESYFRKGRVTTLALPDGRASLTGRNLKITRGPEVVVQREVGDHEYEAVLHDLFGIVLPRID